MPGASAVRAAVLGAALIVTVGGFITPADVAAATAAPSVFVRLRSGPAADALHVPAEVRWTGMTLTSGATYRLHRRVDGGAWTRIALSVPTRDRLAVTLDSWRVYEYRVAVVEATGRIGPWTVAPAVRARMALQTEANATYAGAWKRTPSLALLEGSTRVTSDASASVQFPIGTIGVAWVATRDPAAAEALSRSMVWSRPPSTCARRRPRVGASCGRGPCPHQVRAQSRSAGIPRSPAASTSMACWCSRSQRPIRS